MTPEFSRSERVDVIGEGAREVAIAATADERAALAARFALIAVDRLEGRFTVRRDAAGIGVAGQVSAAVVQACSVTGDPLPAAIEEVVDLRFVSADDLGQAEEIELEDDAVDTVGYQGSAIDLGEVAAETMALALDPFPRSPGAEAILREAGVLREDEVPKVGGLAGLKDLLSPGPRQG